MPEGLATRLTGPGGYYNLGNAIGLGMGLLLQMRLDLSGEAGLFASLGAAGQYLAGGWSAAALTVATIIFFWSGEEYHRAWANGIPNPLRIQRGDFLSGMGSVALGVSLLLVADPILAATSGLLHAAGKFGSAFKLGAHRARLFGVNVPELFRVSVLVSRFPAIVVALIEIARLLGGLMIDPFHDLAMPITLLLCYLLWSRADMLLLNK
ncbi:hypothetical protein [Devosia nitrariae]|uniref:hypothetical protein n=1 Tax=Devosia nitrariae TaxID=2071872 RepID=UPI0024E192D0|nr:hypothetical protein [Devosia nitrariae]